MIFPGVKYFINLLAKDMDAPAKNPETIVINRIYIFVEVNSFPSMLKKFMFKTAYAPVSDLSTL